MQEITERFIEDEPELRKIAVHQDHLDRQDNPGMMSGDDKIEGEPTADKSQRDGTVYFDIHFIAILPSDDGRIENLINCEIQNKMFSTNLSYEDKLDALQNEFKISVSREMSEEVQSMCNLSIGVLNKGRMEQAKAMAYRLREKGMSCEEIADVAEVDIDTVREWFAEREALLVK